MTVAEPTGQPDLERPIDLNDFRDQKQKREQQRPDGVTGDQDDNDPGTPPPMPEPSS
ncbi:hypothetical protein [Actinoplanes sp. DH11]|uniref:hypothetical protein n=1 Tax=Actinoplanes sp. DH11 TaxID=2857011 RepID=UPI001E48B893|nr:hypothetical protein [Actinoplanes sp. DH11]